VRKRRRLSHPAAAADERLTLARPVRRALNQVFPDHWAFALGEVALYCLVVLVLTGTYLTFFFDPSEQHVVYHGRYVPLDDVPMTKAFESTLQISMDTRAGLLIRQMHHWAALLLLAVLVLHLAHKFFTGSFRKPRELNWAIGVALFVITLLEGFTGYTLPDDVLSGASLQIARSVVQSIPVIGTWLMFLICGGEYPGHFLILRLYVAHVLLIPAILFALVGAHLLLLVRQRHAQPYAPDASADRVAGVRTFPVYASRAAGRFLGTAGIVAALGGIAQINPVWLWGPYEPAAVQANSQSDWYFFFLEGSLRLWPPWEIRVFHHTVPAVFFPGVILPVLIFGLTAVYPWLERRFTGDHRRHHVLQRARDTPVRAGIGAAGLTFWVILELAATDDMATRFFHLRIETVRMTGRVLIIVAPVVAFLITCRTCRRLGRPPRDEDPGTVPRTFVRASSGDWQVVSAPARAALDPAVGADQQRRVAVDGVDPRQRRPAHHEGRGGVGVGPGQ
jgi:ubiquinol-cytochrome c reductase cytochrome b subunit